MPSSNLSRRGFLGFLLAPLALPLLPKERQIVDVCPVTKAVTIDFRPTSEWESVKWIRTGDKYVYYDSARPGGAS